VGLPQMAMTRLRLKAEHERQLRSRLDQPTHEEPGAAHHRFDAEGILGQLSPAPYGFKASSDRPSARRCHPSSCPPRQSTCRAASRPVAAYYRASRASKTALSVMGAHLGTGSLSPSPSSGESNEGAGRGHSGEGAISRWPARMAGSSGRSNPVRTDIPSQAVGHIPARGNPVRADILSQAAGHIPA